MKKLFAYKGPEAAAESIHTAAERGDAYLGAIARAAHAVVMAPIKARVKFIKFRLRMTDKYLDAKAKTCERILKKMSEQRKKVAKEQQEARADLKAMRNRFNYPGNPNVIE